MTQTIAFPLWQSPRSGTLVPWGVIPPADYARGPCGSISVGFLHLRLASQRPLRIIQILQNGLTSSPDIASLYCSKNSLVPGTLLFPVRRRVHGRLPTPSENSGQDKDGRL